MVVLSVAILVDLVGQAVVVVLLTKRQIMEVLEEQEMQEVIHPLRVMLDKMVVMLELKQEAVVELVVIELLLLVQLLVEHQFQYNPIQFQLEAAVQDQLLTLLRVPVVVLQVDSVYLQQVVVVEVLV